MVRAEHYFQCKSYTIALQLVEGHIAENKNSAEAHTLLGKIYRELGNTDGQINAYKRLLQLNPNQPDLWKLIVQLRENPPTIAPPIEFVKFEEVGSTEPARHAESAESNEPQMVKKTRKGKSGKQKARKRKASKRKATKMQKIHRCDYPGCDFQSEYKFNVNRHINSEHGLLDKNGRRYREWYYCSICSERSLVKTNMVIHGDRKHSRNAKKFKLIVKKTYVKTD